MAGRSIEAVGRSSGHELPAPNRAPIPPATLSFKDVYAQYFEFVWSSARRLGIDPAGMDDLIQEVFLVIHAKLHTLENPEALRSWIYGVVRRTTSNFRRARRAKETAGPNTAGFEEAQSREPTPLEHTERNASVQLLMSLLGTLDEPKREIFALVEIEEFSVPEAAAALDIPLNTAYSRLRAARLAFEASLSRHEERSKGT